MKKLISVLAFLCVSCATGPTFEQGMNDQIGRMTLDQAFKAYGPPTNCKETENIRVCEWHKSSTELMAVPSPYPTEESISYTEILRLTFTNGVLSGWQKFEE
jgi:hypothetical protein